MAGSEIITPEYVELYDELETDKAWCFRFDDDNVDERIWLPKSQVEDIRETCNEVDVPLWLAEAKELEDFCK